MLPDWDIGDDDAKLRTLTEWVGAELDRLAVITTDRFISHDELPDDWMEAALHTLSQRRSVGGQPKSDADRAVDGMDTALADYIMIKSIFKNYWPGRKRPLDHPASAERIAVRRNWRELSEVAKSSDWSSVIDDEAEARTAHEIEKAEKLHKAWKSWKARPGKRMGEGDLTYLEGLYGKKS